MPGLECVVLIRDFVTHSGIGLFRVHTWALPGNNIDIGVATLTLHCTVLHSLWQAMDRTSPQYYNLSWTSLMLTKLFRNNSLLSDSFDSQDALVTDMTRSTKKARIEPQHLRGKLSNDSFLTEEDLNIHDSVSIRTLSSVDTQSGQSVWTTKTFNLISNSRFWAEKLQSSDFSSSWIRRKRKASGDKVW